DGTRIPAVACWIPHRGSSVMSPGRSRGPGSRQRGASPRAKEAELGFHCRARKPVTREGISMLRRVLASLAMVALAVGLGARADDSAKKPDDPSSIQDELKIKQIALEAQFHKLTVQL